MDFDVIPSLWEKLPRFLQDPDPRRLLSGNYIVLDFETTNLDKGSPYNPNNTIVLSTWVCPRYKSIKYMWGNEFEQEELAEEVERADIVVAHNTKFEIGWLDRMNVDVSNKLFFCTQIAEYVLWGNLPNGRQQSLDKCLERRGMPLKDDLVGRLIKGGMCPSHITKSWLLRYGLTDTDRTHSLFLSQREELERGGLLPVTFSRNLVTPVLVSLEKRGLCLDSERVEKVQEIYSEKLAHLEVQWEEVCGDVNINSPPQKRELFFETLGFDPPKNARGKPMLTPKGELSTDEKTLARLKAKTEEQKNFLGLFKKVNKIKSTKSKFLDKMKLCCEQAGGILQAAFNQTITQTHRLSSSGKEFSIQIQNIDRRLKPLFKARFDGWDIAEIDADSLEFRSAGHLGRDEVVRDDLEEGRDPHAYSAHIIFSDKWNDTLFPKEGTNAPLRQDAKAHTFKPLYGGMFGTPKEMEYYKAFKDRYRGITDTQERWKREALNTKQLKTETGLVFYWPNIKMNSRGYINESTNICNYPVQNLATAEVVPAAMVYQWHLMRIAGLQSFLVNTIHDSTIGEVHPDEREYYTAIAEAAFTEIATWYLRTVYGIELFVPLSATVEYNKFWSDKEEWLKLLAQ